METKEIKLTDVCDFQGGTQPPKEEWINEPRPGFVRMLQIRDFTQSKAEHVAYVRDTQNLNKCKAEDILIGRYGASVGKILTGHEGAYNVAIIKTIPDETRLLKKYLYYVLTGNAFQNFISSIGARAAQAGFNKDDLSYFKLHLPSLENQERIATILGKAEALIKQRKESNDVIEELLKFTFLKMFGDPIRNEKRWIKHRMKDVLNDIISGWSPICEDYPRESDDELAILKLSSVTQGYFNPKQNKKLKNGTIVKKRVEPLKGDLLFSRKNTFDLVGATAYIFTDYPNLLLSDTIFKLVYDTSKVNGFYLWKLLSNSSNRKQISKIASGSAGSMPNISQERLLNFSIILPPLEFQMKFASIVEEAEELKLQYKNSLQQLQKLYTSLSQKAFLGELHLKQIKATVVVEGHTEEKVIQKINKDLEDFHKSIPHSGASDEIDNTLRQLDMELQFRGEIRFWDEYVKYRIIRQKFSNAFTFDEFWKEFIKVSFDEPQSFDKIKELVFSLLKTDKPFLLQRFNESKKQIELLINETVTA
jgi:type I restriction enzyme S subunit